MAINEPPCKAAWVVEKRQPYGRSQQCDTMRRQDPQGHAVPRTSHAQRALPNARRHQHWAAHRSGVGAFKSGQLEGRPVFCKGETGGEVASPVATRVQGTVPQYYEIMPSCFIFQTGLASVAAT
jgi:hypothetical protein